MPTARELLEQADNLMRRNRQAAGAPGAVADIPVLTEAVPGAIAKPASRTARDPVPAGGGKPVSEWTLDDVPLLTDVVEEIEATSIVEPVNEDDLPSQWLDIESGDLSIMDLQDDTVALPPRVDSRGTAPATSVPAPPSPAVIEAEAPGPAARTPDQPEKQEAEEKPENPLRAVAKVRAPAPPEVAVQETPAAVDATRDAPTLGSGIAHDLAAAVATAVATAAATDAAIDAPPDAPIVSFEPMSAETESSGRSPSDQLRFEQLAEEIRMQVLQRIDIFTDIGLHDQLSARLKPIVDRASGDLVVAINQHVGQLLRAYVAEAIEREIQNLRDRGG